MKHENNFNILRLLAAFMVIVGHMLTLLGRPVMSFLHSSVHEIGVFIFFLVGGYLITKSYLSDPHPVRYTLKRIFRIYPALMALIIFTVLIAGPMLTTLPIKEYFAHPLTKPYFWNNLRMFPNFSLPGVFDNNPVSNAVCGSLWTLPIEIAMYVVLPLLINLTGVRKDRKYSKVVWCLITIAVFAASVIRKKMFSSSQLVFYGTDWCQALNIVPYYFIGSMYAICVPKEKFDLQKAVMLFLFCMIINGSSAVEYVLLAIALPYLVFSIAFAPQPVFSKVMKKHEISYGIYLYGFFVQQLVIHIFYVKLGIQAHYLVCLVLSMLGTVVLAYLSAIFVEEPFGKLSKKILAKINKK